MKWIIREQQSSQSAFNAGSKARNDVDKILTSQGFNPLIVVMKLENSTNIIGKLTSHLKKYSHWKKMIGNVQEKDEVVIQYPVRSHTLLFGSVLKAVKKKDVKIIGIIHDLESLRLAISKNSSAISRIRFKYEELSALKYFDKIVVHNEYMREAIHEFFDVPIDKMVNLDIFDYLYEPKDSEEHAISDGPVIIAGNLDKNKCGYIYNLPENVRFDLYGGNYDERAQKSENVRYLGKVDPDELPSLLRGSFGLVWDGPSADGCQGVYGEYLKYNNPHKASLYLASGIPIIVWEKSALADFVSSNQCGVLVDSLKTINSNCRNIDYSIIKQNAERVGKMIRSANYLKSALVKALE